MNSLNFFLNVCYNAVWTEKKLKCDILLKFHYIWNHNALFQKKVIVQVRFE